MQINRITPILLLSLGIGMSSSMSWANSVTDAPDNPADMESNHSGLLDQIPRLIDATPTILPEQSDEAIVPSMTETENNSWADKRQKGIREWADRTAHKIDNWFGKTDPDQPANATLRIILDNSWDKYETYEIKPRIRGKIKLPTLEQKLSLVFGDDSLDNELDTNAAITNENLDNARDKNLDIRRTRENNSSFALRWSEFADGLPFDTDLDLGVRSGDDIYARAKISRDWTMENDFSFHAEQIYRYGLQSENYLRTNLELIHARPNQAFFSNQLSLTYADEQEDDLTWDNYTFRQHQFFQENRFNYGIYTGGYLEDKDLRLNRWGPYVSWRQPFLREWFFVQADLNYLNDDRLNRSHYLGALVRMEAIF
ncbi:hypothetical protein [Acinetobacter pecorum]